MSIIITLLQLCVSFSVALLLASIGEMFNQRAGVFNLGCEGIMAMGAFVGMLVVYYGEKASGASALWNILGFLSAGVLGLLLGLFYGLIVVTFRAPQGIAGIGFQMFGVGVAGTLFRHFVGGVQNIVGVVSKGIPGLRSIPFLGPVLFSHNIYVYIAFALVPVSMYILFKTPWGLKLRAVGTYPRAADTMAINVNLLRYQSLAVGGVFAGLAGAYLSIAQAHLFNDTLISGRGFIAVALVYFGHWHPLQIMGGAMLFTFAQVLQTQIQSMGINFPYEFFVMLPYILVVLVLSFTSKNNKMSPASLGKPFNREQRT